MRCCRSVSYSTEIGRPRRAVAVHGIERGSSGRDSGPLETARAWDARAALTRVVREAAAQRHLVAADLMQIGVHVRRRGRGDAALSFDEVQRTAQTEMDVAEGERPAVMRARGVLGLPRLARSDRDTGTPPIDVERDGDRIGELQPQRPREGIRHAQRHAVGYADRQLRVRDPLDPDARGRWGRTVVDDR